MVLNSMVVTLVVLYLFYIQINHQHIKCTTESSSLCWIIGQQTIAERNVEQTKDVRMYIEEFILVDVVTLLYKLELNWICIGNAVVYIHSQQ